MSSMFDGFSDEEVASAREGVGEIQELIDKLKYAYHNFEYLPVDLQKRALGVAVKFIENGSVAAQMLLEAEALTRNPEATE